MGRIVIDPVSHAGGQLRIEAELGGGRVTDAWSSGTMFRGIETILNGRDPRDAWLLAERICGSCTTVHALASVRAVEHALGVTIPTNARLVRNLLASTALIRDHVLSFYTAQVPDWADTAAALTADPVATAKLARESGGWSASSPDHFAQVQARLAAASSGGVPGPFDTGWAGHPGYALTPEANLLLLAHLVDALDWQRELMRIHVLLGGKDPHPQTYLVGGMSLAPPWGGPVGRLNRDHPDVPQRNSPDPLSTEGLDFVAARLASARVFVEQAFVPDVRLARRGLPGVGRHRVGSRQLPRLRGLPAGRRRRSRPVPAPRAHREDRPARGRGRRRGPDRRIRRPRVVRLRLDQRAAPARGRPDDPQPSTCRRCR